LPAGIRRRAGFELSKSQLDADFIETEVPSSGLGGFSITPGLPYPQFPSARIILNAQMVTPAVAEPDEMP
jgi:hypothetical protein